MKRICNAWNALLGKVEPPPPAPPPIDESGREVYQVKPFQDTGGEWRWRVLSPKNHRNVAASGEAFDSKSNARAAARRICAARLEFVE